MTKPPRKPATTAALDKLADVFWQAAVAEVDAKMAEEDRAKQTALKRIPLNRRPAPASLQITAQTPSAARTHEF